MPQVDMFSHLEVALFHGYVGLMTHLKSHHSGNLFYVTGDPVK
jgi:hypothetical protein